MVFLVIMGVCGCGKTTVGQSLAKEMKIPFNDADDFHTSANKRKMNQGIPLTDEDRFPWLAAIHRHMINSVKKAEQGIVACSSLKKIYRHILLTGSTSAETTQSIENDVIFIHLKAAPSVIKKRLLDRTDHFMSATLLDSQIDILEELGEEENHLVVDVEKDVENIVKEILFQLNC